MRSAGSLTMTSLLAEKYFRDKRLCLCVSWVEHGKLHLCIGYFWIAGDDNDTAGGAVLQTAEPQHVGLDEWEYKIDSRTKNRRVPRFTKF